MAQSPPDNPSFECYSGKLIWGQLHCIAEGCLSENTGTIVGDDFNYKVNAARGRWNVKELLYNAQTESSVAGFIIYNQKIADPVAILQSCAGLGTSSNEDQTIIYVNRYDWSRAHDLKDVCKQLLHDGLNADRKRRINLMFANRLILADARAGLDVIKQFKENWAGIPLNALIKDTLIVGHNAVGVHLGYPITEYELGWMVFNPSNKEELVAFVYKCSCTALVDISLGD